MIATERLHFKRLVRVRDLVLAKKDQLPALAGQFIDNLKASVSRLAALVGVQESLDAEARDTERVKQQVRQALRADLSAIRLAATAIAVESPGFDDRFQTPPVGDQKLLAAGRAFAVHAAPVADSLIQYALRASFIEDLNKNVQLFETALADHEQALHRCKDGAALIEKAMQEASNATIHLDALFRNSFRNDPAALSAWDDATRSGWSRRKTNDKENESSAPAPSPPDNAAATAA